MSPSGGFDLLRPAQLIWVLAAVLLLVVALLSLAARRRDRAKLVAARHMARFLPNYSEGRAVARVVLATTGVLLLAVALSGPVRGWTMRAVQRRGLDLVVCIDTSHSMLVRDVRPDRLSRALREVGGLIDRLEGDRVALLAFSGDAREVAPLTHDRTTLRALLERVTPDDNVVGGTDLGAALQRALSLFDGRTGAHEAIVLLTDGEDLSGHGLDVARAAAEAGIRIYVVGMGTGQGGKIPLVDEAGRESFLADGEGAEVISALDGSSLEQIASVTGGDYLAATRSAAPLEELYQMRISRLEGRDLQGGKEWVPHDRFQWLLVLALSCMLLESGLRERVARRRAPASAALLFVLPFAGGIDTERVLELSRTGDHAGAIQAAEELLASSEWGAASELERAATLYDVGVAHHRAEHGLQAIGAFVQARDLAGPGELRLDAAYNIAALLLAEAEQVRATLPEISGGNPPPGAIGLQGPPGAGQAAGQAADEEPPDPLDVAEQTYRGALIASVDRVRLDATCRDTRANLELIRRRLKELEEIREQREKQQQDQEQEQEQQDSEENQDGESGESDDSQDSEQQPPEDQDSQDQESQEQEDEQEDEQQGEDEQPPQPEPSESEEEQQPAQPDAAEEERMMSREEIQRLLDRLAEIEKQARAVQQALTERRRVPVDEDW